MTTVRAAVARDLAAVRELLTNSELPLDGVEEQFGPAYVVAVREGSIVGVEGIERYGTSGLLRSAAVSVQVRGTGLGRRLTEDRIAWARAQGLQDLWLLTTTAAPYFERFGFQVVERSSAPDALKMSREFAHACPATATTMRLALS